MQGLQERRCGPYETEEEPKYFSIDDIGPDVCSVGTAITYRVLDERRKLHRIDVIVEQYRHAHRHGRVIWDALVRREDQRPERAWQLRSSDNIIGWNYTNPLDAVLYRAAWESRSEL